MIDINHPPSDIVVRLAESEEEMLAAQRLRYHVFYEEFQAQASEKIKAAERDFDEYDAVADHLVVIDETRSGSDKIVGTYRLLRQEIAQKHGAFYTSGEYDISPLLGCRRNLLELGRSCVLAEYRTRPVIQLLWQGISNYLKTHHIGLMFGCASIHETDIGKISKWLAYLYHYHLAPEELRVRALDKIFIDMSLHKKEHISPRDVFSELPPLIKGYLRLGAYIGDGAVIDPVFRTTDVCIILPTEKVTERYRSHYSRKQNISISKEQLGTASGSIKRAPENDAIGVTA